MLPLSQIRVRPLAGHQRDPDGNRQWPSPSENDRGSKELSCNKQDGALYITYNRGIEGHACFKTCIVDDGGDRLSGRGIRPLARRSQGCGLRQ
jgi:hypothetical protein